MWPTILGAVDNDAPHSHVPSQCPPPGLLCLLCLEGWCCPASLVMLARPPLPQPFKKACPVWPCPPPFPSRSLHSRPGPCTPVLVWKALRPFPIVKANFTAMGGGVSGWLLPWIVAGSRAAMAPCCPSASQGAQPRASAAVWECDHNPPPSQVSWHQWTTFPPPSAQVQFAVAVLSGTTGGRVVLH